MCGPHAACSSPWGCRLGGGEVSASDGSQKEQVLPSAWGPWREGDLLMVRKEEALLQYLPWGFQVPWGLRALGNPYMAHWPG